MSWTRRSFLATGSSAAGLLVFGRSSYAIAPTKNAEVRARVADRLVPGSPELKALAARALEAATAAGATYADVQFRTRMSELWMVGTERDVIYPTYPAPGFSIATGIGVRALFNGYWGFSGQYGVVTADAAAALGRNATAQAKIAATGKAREVALAPCPVVADGRWATPVEVDPFTVSDAEKLDVMLATVHEIDNTRFISYFTGMMSAQFVKEERTVATSDGSFFALTQFVTSPGYQIAVKKHLVSRHNAVRNDTWAGPVGAGWEAVLRYPYRDRLPQMTDEALRLRASEPIDVGRYDVVFDAGAIAAMLHSTISPATEGDRAMGLLANGVGTSFLNEPLEMLGTFQVAAPLVTITANRSMPRGAATVAWDDEGVVPVDTPLVKDGIVADFQTTREGAGWFTPYYQKRGLPVRSNGCAGTGDVGRALTQVPPNLAVTPATQSADFIDLVRATKKGLAVVDAGIDIDFQGMTGLGRGTLCYEVTNGVLGKQLAGGSWNFRTTDFWKSVTAIGGTASARAYGFSSARDGGAPNYRTIAAVPMAVRNVVFVTKGQGM